MWGFYNKRNRQLARQVYMRIIDLTISESYNFKRNLHHGDQNFLAMYVYPLIKDKALIHDSYYCNEYKDSEPFPTKRIGNCSIGMFHAENCEKVQGLECPVKCRLKDHHDWVFC